jgi:hypothetical protein
MQRHAATHRDRASGRSKRPLFRKALILPAEHGSWSWLLVPFLAGVAVARHLEPALLLVLVGALAAFLLRQPATAWLRIRQGKGRRSDEGLALGWTVGLGLVALLSLVALLALGHLRLLWLLPPVVVMLALYLALARGHRAQVRNLWLELAGAGVLAAMAPAAYVTATGGLDAIAWSLWLVMGLQNGLGVLYVRQRLADTKPKHEPLPRLMLGGHLLGLLLVAALVATAFLPPLVLLPFAALALRAAYYARRPQPLEDIRRFGFREVGVELISALWVAAGYAAWW